MVRKKEVVSLEQLYEKYKKPIYTLCVKLAGAGDDAADLYSDTWMRVAEKQGQIDHQRNVINWIYTICLNLYRKSFARPKIIDSYDGSDSFLQIKSENETTDVAFIKKENAEILKEKLSKLDDKYRVPLILFYFKELSYNDISEIMKLPLSTVKFRLNQAKNILRKEMEVYFE